MAGTWHTQQRPNRSPGRNQPWTSGAGSGGGGGIAAPAGLVGDGTSADTTIVDALGCRCCGRDVLEVHILLNKPAETLVGCDEGVGD